MKKFLLIAALIIILVSCQHSDAFYDKEYYERISSIRIPGHAKVIESVDNFEFVTATCFQMKADSIRWLTDTYNFIPLKPGDPQRLLSSTYLMEEKPDTDYPGSYFYNSGTHGRSEWLYVVDTVRNLLWAEIRYPDAGGD